MKNTSFKYLYILSAMTLAIYTTQGCSDQKFSSVASDPSTKAEGDPDVVPVDSVDPSDDETTDQYACDEKEKKKYCDTEEIEHPAETLSTIGSTHASKKVMVCHIPPGNPEARHEICISVNALHAHIGPDHGDSQTANAKDHKDYLGYCEGDSADE
jgi:hypothetical protein